MIQTAQLAYRYAGGATLHFPDVDVPQGSVLLLQGPSGSGKSTWLALAAGLLRATSGQITVAGQDLNALKNIATDAWRARAIGFLPQKLHLSDALTVPGNLAMAQWAAGVPDDAAAIDRVLDTLDLAELRHRKPGQLSGGQAQIGQVQRVQHAVYGRCVVRHARRPLRHGQIARHGQRVTQVKFLR